MRGGAWRAYRVPGYASTAASGLACDAIIATQQGPAASPKTKPLRGETQPEAPPGPAAMSSQSNPAVGPATTPLPVPQTAGAGRGRGAIRGNRRHARPPAQQAAYWPKLWVC